MTRQILDVSRLVRESLTPEPNGTTTTFQTSRPFTAGTVSLWVNGLLYEAGVDPWQYTESGQTVLTLAQPPRAGDTLQVQYEALT